MCLPVDDREWWLVRWLVRDWVVVSGDRLIGWWWLVRSGWWQRHIEIWWLGGEWVVKIMTVTYQIDKLSIARVGFTKVVLASLFFHNFTMLEIFSNLLKYISQHSVRFPNYFGLKLLGKQTCGHSRFLSNKSSKEEICLIRPTTPTYQVFSYNTKFC